MLGQLDNVSRALTGHGADVVDGSGAPDRYAGRVTPIACEEACGAGGKASAVGRATLLVTARLNDSAEAPRPLSLSEYHQLARWLEEMGLTLAALLREGKREAGRHWGTTVIVLVPFVYLQGDLRIYYMPLAIVVGLSLIASLFVAFTFIPSLGAQLLTISVKEPFPYSAIPEMQPTPPQEFYDAQERIAAARVKAVVDALRARGELSNTLIVYTDDNGKVPVLECVRRAEQQLCESAMPRANDSPSSSRCCSGARRATQRHDVV